MSEELVYIQNPYKDGESGEWAKPTKKIIANKERRSEHSVLVKRDYDLNVEFIWDCDRD